jgi:excinuclease ABC subunit C
MLTKPDNIPTEPGVYIFRTHNTPIYIGKAANLKKRLASYFRARTSKKIRQLTNEATRLDWTICKSGIAALIEEARLIKTHIPKYNVLMRDDKNYAYVAITKELFPRIYITHQPKGKSKKSEVKYIGPFTSSSALKQVLNILRRSFRYCTCKDQHKRRCLNAEIGRCMGYCCFGSDDANADKKRTYRAHINHITQILTGKSKTLLRELKKDMRQAAKGEKYELAADMRDKIASVEHILKHASVLETEPAAKNNAYHLNRALINLFGPNTSIRRSEAYDISNISGNDATGSMVVFDRGIPQKSEYRISNIKTVQGANDVAMHREALARRLRHTEWPYPDLIVMDGGKPQLNAARAVLREYTDTKDIILTALAKREEELFIAGRALPVRLDTLPPVAANFFKHIRDESHRFAKKQHHRLRKKALENSVI